jgi:hypothetical protein
MKDRHADILYRRLLAGRVPTDADRAHAITCSLCQRAMSDAEQLDERLHVAARGLANGSMPEGLLRHDSTPRRTVVGAAAPVMAAVLVIAVALGLAFGSWVPRIGTATTSPEASGLSGAPSPIETSIPSPVREAEGDLVKGPYGCGDGAGGFIVWIPDGWYANAAHDGIPACRLVSTEPFEVRSLDNAPAVPIRLTVETGDFAITGNVLERSELTIADLPALRLVINAESGRRLVYIVGLDGSLPFEGNPGRFVFATTLYGNPSFERDSAALDEMFSRFHGQEPFKDNPEAVAAAALFASTKTCANLDGQFQIAFPATWFTNPVSEDAPACTWFGPAELLPAGMATGPENAVVSVIVFPGGVGSFEPGFAYETLNVGGRPAERVERHAGTPPEPDLSVRSYLYIIQLGDVRSVATVVAMTRSSITDDYDLAKAVLDLMMESLQLTGS